MKKLINIELLELSGQIKFNDCFDLIKLATVV